MGLRTWITAVFMALFLASVAGAGLVEDARKALESGDYKKALELAGKVPEKAKERWKALCVIGDVELAQERFEQAEAAFREALDMKPKSVPAMTGIGRALTGQGKLAEGGQILGKAMELDNQDIGMWHALIANMIARGKPEDYEGALVNLNATMYLDAKNATTNRLLVETLLKLEKVDEADKAAETYAKADKDSATSWYLRGLVLEKRKKNDKAIEAYQKAVKKDDRLREAHGNLALLLAASDTGDKNEARLAEARVHARRYVDLLGKDKAVVALLEKLEAAGSTPAK
jgi:superkiller protein 3